MSIQYSFTSKDNLLIVTASGKDDDLAQVKEYGLSIIQACNQHHYNKVLIDERNLAYQLDTFDTYELAEYYSQHAASVAKVALVCNPKNYQDASFWESAVVNRGLIIKIFTDLAEAKAWLDQ